MEGDTKSSFDLESCKKASTSFKIDDKAQNQIAEVEAQKSKSSEFFDRKYAENEIQNGEKSQLSEIEEAKVAENEIKNSQLAQSLKNEIQFEAQGAKIIENEFQLLESAQIGQLAEEICKNGQNLKEDSSFIEQFKFFMGEGLKSGVSCALKSNGSSIQLSDEKRAEFEATLLTHLYAQIGTEDNLKTLLLDLN